MNRISHWVLVLTALLAIAYVNLNAWQSQQIKLRGEILFLELAPVDPLSLVQGQYMRLRFGIEKRYDTTQEDYRIIQNNRGNGLAMISLDSKRIGTLTGLLAPNQWQQVNVNASFSIQKLEFLILVSRRGPSNRLLAGVRILVKTLLVEVEDTHVHLCSINHVWDVET